MSKVILLNKPFNVLCQFTDSENRETLANFLTDSKFRRYYPAGRLDRDSEGLVVLTDDGKLQNRIASPKHKLSKTYWVQIEGDPNEEAIERLSKGVQLKDGLTLPARAKIIDEPALWERIPPIRERQHIPTRWIELEIKEGKNRQVRRMTAAVGHPTLRLVRAHIGPWSLAGLMPGEYRTEVSTLR